MKNMKGTRPATSSSAGGNAIRLSSLLTAECSMPVENLQGRRRKKPAEITATAAGTVPLENSGMNSDKNSCLNSDTQINLSGLSEYTSNFSNKRPYKHRGQYGFQHDSFQGGNESFLAQFCIRLRQGQWSALEKMASGLTSIRVVQVLQSCEGVPCLALEFFNWVEHQGGFQHTLQSYCATALVLTHGRMFGDAQTLLQRLVQVGLHAPPAIVVYLTDFYRGRSVRVTPAVFDILINAYIKVGRIAEATEGFYLLKKYGFMPTVQSCNNLLIALVKSDRTPRAFELFNEMLVNHVHPNIFSYNIMIHGFCKEEKVQEARDLIQSMGGHGCSPDVVTYNTLIDGYCRKGKEKRRKQRIF